MLFDFLIFEKMDPRNCIKFCIKNQIKCQRIFEMLTMAFGESTMNRTQVQFWYNRFKEGQEDVNDIARPGRRSTLTTDENIEAVKKIILDNRRITIVRLMPNNFCSCFKHETCSREACSKIAKF